MLMQPMTNGNIRCRENNVGLFSVSSGFGRSADRNATAGADFDTAL